MTVRQALVHAAAALEEAAVRSPRDDAHSLLCLALDWDRSRLLADPGYMLTEKQKNGFGSLLERRLDHEPLQYLRGRQEFYGRDFRVSPAVLIPRPETELVVEQALECLGRCGAPPHLLDVGTGSGCIAVTLLSEEPALRASATDISAKALAVARENALALECADRLTLIRGSLFEPVPGLRFDLIVSNPPYVALRDREQVDRSVRRWEPPEAVFAGPEGLAVIAPLLAEAADYLAEGGFVVLEFGAGQQAALKRVARIHRWKVCRISSDLAGIERCAVLSR